MYRFEEIFAEYIVPALVSGGTTLILVGILTPYYGVSIKCIT